MNETGKPIGSEYGSTANGDVARSKITPQGKLVAVFNLNLQDSDPTELAAIMAHEPFHQDAVMTLDIADEANRFSIGSAQRALSMEPHQSVLPPHILLVDDGS